MEASPVLILLYRYPYQIEVMFISLVILLIISSIAYGIYRLITWKMNVRVKTIFNSFLKIAGISIVVIFFAEVTLSIISIHHVNKQLGFSYATPDTPEGELFEISKVVPGKTMDNAGLKLGDQIQMHSTNDLYQLLTNNQGKEVLIPVLRNKKKLKIRVSVPELDVPLEGVSFLF